MSMMEPEPEPTPEEIATIVEQGGPWITVTFTSEDQTFEQKRVLSLAQAESLRDELTLEVRSAKDKYNIERGEQNDERRTTDPE